MKKTHMYCAKLKAQTGGRVKGTTVWGKFKTGSDGEMCPSPL
jgi:hypothetical protein